MCVGSSKSTQGNTLSHTHTRTRSANQTKRLVCYILYNACMRNTHCAAHIIWAPTSGLAVLEHSQAALSARALCTFLNGHRRQLRLHKNPSGINAESLAKALLHCAHKYPNMYSLSRTRRRTREGLYVTSSFSSWLTVPYFQPFLDTACAAFKR